MLFIPMLNIIHFNVFVHHIISDGSDPRLGSGSTFLEEPRLAPGLSSTSSFTFKAWARPELIFLRLEPSLHIISECCLLFQRKEKFTLKMFEGPEGTKCIFYSAMCIPISYVVLEMFDHLMVKME